MLLKSAFKCIQNIFLIIETFLTIIELKHLKANVFTTALIHIYNIKKIGAGGTKSYTLSLLKQNSMLYFQS